MNLEIDLQKVTVIIQTLKKNRVQLGEVIDVQDSDFEYINRTDIWRGNAIDHAYLKYGEVKKRQEDFMAELNYCIDFLTAVVDSYSSQDKALLEKANDL